MAVFFVILDLGKVCAASLISIAVLFILTKMLGYKQVSQLSMFDYVNGISIGSIAAEMATEIDGDVIKPLTAMIVYAIVVLLINFGSLKWIKFRRFFEGKSSILYENSKLYVKNLKKAQFDISEFLAECRLQGYFDLNDISLAILESNGKVSILPNTAAKTTTVGDFNAEGFITNKKKPAKPCVNVIMDGLILEKNLTYSGNNDIWLKNELDKQGLRDINKIFLANVDEKNQLNVYMKIDDMPKNDIFQ